MLFHAPSCRAVKILKKCAETDKIDFLIARDKKAQDNFRRLSQTIVFNSKRPGKLNRTCTHSDAQCNGEMYDD